MNVSSRTRYRLCGQQRLVEVQRAFNDDSVKVAVPRKSNGIQDMGRKCANLSWKLKRLQTLWFDGIGRNNIKPVRERSRDEESVTFGEKTQEEASTG